MTRRRPLLFAALLAVVATCLTVTVGVVAAPRPDGRPADLSAESPAGPPAEHGNGSVAAIGVLADWDARRAAAWASADPDTLRALYLPGSGVGERDVALLERYRDRGLRVVDMTRQVLAVEVVHRSAERLRLRVTDRLAGATAVDLDDPGRRTPLPTSRPRTRSIALVATAGRWRVEEVRQP